VKIAAAATNTVHPTTCTLPAALVADACSAGEVAEGLVSIGVAVPVILLLVCEELAVAEPVLVQGVDEFR